MCCLLSAPCATWPPPNHANQGVHPPVVAGLEQGNLDCPRRRDQDHRCSAGGSIVLGITLFSATHPAPPLRTITYTFRTCSLAHQLSRNYQAETLTLEGGFTGRILLPRFARNDSEHAKVSAGIDRGALVAHLTIAPKPESLHYRSRSSQCGLHGLCRLA